MRYSTPYNDRITLPHIKRINTIGINADNLFYDSRELSGQVIIDGDYLTDNGEDIMSFTHDLPVSVLIDDADIDPEVHISNFKYELIPGVGLEIMFELDMILTEKEKVEEEIEEEEKKEEEQEEQEEDEESLNKRIEEIDKQLEENKEQLESLSNTSEEVEQIDEDVVEFKKQIDNNLDKLIGDRKDELNDKLEEVVEEPVEEAKEELNVDDVEEMENDKEEVKEKAKEIEVLTEQKIVKAEVSQLSAKLQATSTSFDTGFIGSGKDRFTTYKIILLEENENIDEVLEARNLSRALVCDEYKSDRSKIILKIEND